MKVAQLCKFHGVNNSVISFQYTLLLLSVILVSKANNVI